MSMRQEVFEKIYTDHSWAGKSRSGPGSDPEHTGEYVRFVSNWLAGHPDVKQIVELGCGDWATSRLITFLPTQRYIGLDIVRQAIESDRQKYSGPNVRFQVCDFLSEAPPAGDVLLVKDVLQHLSNKNVEYVLQTLLPRYRYALITNDVARYEVRRFLGITARRRSLGRVNIDVPDGDSRPVDIEDEPFNLSIAGRFSYQVLLRVANPHILYVKDILVWENQRLAPAGANRSTSDG